MLRSLFASLIILAALLPQPVQSAGISDFRWLSGSWEANVGTGLMDEHWNEPSGDTIQGMGRGVRNGKTVFLEFMLIRPEGADIVLTIIPPGEQEIKFRLTQSSSNEAVFENPARDFPKKILYRLNADGSIFSRVEGHSNGKPISQDFAFRRKR